MSIGRAPQGGLRLVGWVHLKDETVSSLQAELRWNDQTRRFTLINRSETNPTKVNEVLVSEVELEAGDQIRMGKCVLDLQQADMRFGGRLQPRSSPPEASPPQPQPQPQPVEASPARAVSLTSRPACILEILAGTNAGQQLPLRGLTLALGGAIHPDEILPPEARWFDQELAFGDLSLPPRCLALCWQQRAQGFDLVRPNDNQVVVTVTRQEDGLEWVAVVDPGQAGFVLVNDVIQLGRNRFQLVAPIEGSLSPFGRE